jgi:predicted deacylase
VISEAWVETSFSGQRLFLRPEEKHMKGEPAMEIFGISVQMGEKAHQQILVGELANGSPIYTPVMVIRGNRPGPVLWICGAVHGDELNGLFAMRNVYLETRPEDVKGSLIFTPILNPIAFVEQKKLGFLDVLNMDIQFPGKADGLISQRIASQVFLEIKRIANALINFHTQGPWGESLVYTVAQTFPGANPRVVEKSFRMALSFGVKANCQVDFGTTKDELPGLTGGNLNTACIASGIPAFSAEVGLARRWEVPSVAIAQKGVYNVMRFLGMTEGELERSGEQIIIPRRKSIRNSRGGLTEMLVRPGDIVRKGEVFARVINFWEVLEEFRTEEDSYVLGVRANPTASSGDRIGIIGFDWYDVK